MPQIWDVVHTIGGSREKGERMASTSDQQPSDARQDAPTGPHASGSGNRIREVILDTETTGFEPQSGHRVVEIGCVELINHQPSGKVWHTHLNPERDVPEEAFRAHGLSSDLLADKPVFAEKVAEFLVFIGDAPLVAHNAEFDMRFINAEMVRLGFPALPMARAIDTVAIARRLFPGAPANLNALCRRFQIDTTHRTRHGALLDAEILAEVYLRLIALGHDDAEKTLLATGLQDNGLIVKVASFLKPDHFTQAIHARIYSALCRTIDHGKQVGAPELKLTLSLSGDTAGAEYLSAIVGLAVSAELAQACGRRIHDSYLRRALIGVAEAVIADASSPSDPDECSALDLIGMAEAKLYELAVIGQNEGGFEPFRCNLEGAIRYAEAAHKLQREPSGLLTGLIDLDRQLGGLQNGELIVLAGRPSMGTTALAANIAFNAARAYREEADNLRQRNAGEGARVAFFSLEMSAKQLTTRILATQAEIPSYKIHEGKLENREFEDLYVTAQGLGHLPLFIDDTPGLSVLDLRTRARQLKRQLGVGLIIVDNIQLLRTSHGVAGDFSGSTRWLKALACELNIPVLAISGLDRAIESREDKRPMLHDLRGSGSIEQDADVVMLLFREEYYLARAEPYRHASASGEKFNHHHAAWNERLEEVRNTAAVIIAKHRNRPVGTVYLSFHAECGRFGDLGA